MQKFDTLQGSAVRNAESIFFWAGFRCLLGRYERLKKCVQERSDKFNVCHGGAKGSGRGARGLLLQAEATRGTLAEKVQK